MKPMDAIKVIQEYTKDLELTAEEHIEIGNAIVTLYDYIQMLESALIKQKKSGGIDG